jgi:hypothetical protein
MQNFICLSQVVHTATMSLFYVLQNKGRILLEDPLQTEFQNPTVLALVSLHLRRSHDRQFGIADGRKLRNTEAE